MELFDLGLIILTSLVSFMGSWSVLHFAPQLGLISHPNQRSSHEVATPHGGGFGITFSFLIAASLLFATGKLEETWWQVLVACGIPIAGIGLWGDLYPAPAKWRLLIHFVAVGAAVTLLGGLPPLAVGQGSVDLGWVGSIGVVVALVWWLNLYNFMDGIDGIASMEAICILLGGMIVLYWGSLYSLNPYPGKTFLISWILIASLTGFLILNWSPARVFMGDIGSIFLGYILGMLTFISIVEKELPPWVWLILGGVFWVDATVTLLHRIKKSETLYEAHRSHSYQLFALKVAGSMKNRKGLSAASARSHAHRSVCWGVAAINLFWLVPMACLSLSWPEWGWGLLIVAWLPLVGLVIFSSRTLNLKTP